MLKIESRLKGNKSHKILKIKLVKFIQKKIKQWA